MIPLKEGIFYDYPEHMYHADPCSDPSLSASIIKPLLTQSPLHAWYKHSRLNPSYEPENKNSFDIGRAAHSLILNDPKNFEIVDAPDWRKKENQEKRDNAYICGRIPLLKSQHEEVLAMVARATEQLTTHECENAFSIKGKSEVTLIWQECDVWCRARVDYIAENGRDFYDYKTTDQSANPENASRLIFNLRYDITSAFYRRGIRKLFGIENPNYRFVIQEKEAPYALSIVALDPAAEGLADRKIDEAIRLWGECLRTNTWPGYTNRIAYVGAPAWHEKQWLDREAREEFILSGNGGTSTVATVKDGVITEVTIQAPYVDHLKTKTLNY